MKGAMEQNQEEEEEERKKKLAEEKRNEDFPNWYAKQLESEMRRLREEKANHSKISLHHYLPSVNILQRKEEEEEESKEKQAREQQEVQNTQGVRHYEPIDPFSFEEFWNLCTEAKWNLDNLVIPTLHRMDKESLLSLFESQIPDPKTVEQREKAEAEERRLSLATRPVAEGRDPKVCLFTQVNQLRRKEAKARTHNLKVRIVRKNVLVIKGNPVVECLVGDDTGTIMFVASDVGPVHQIMSSIEPESTLILHDAVIKTDKAGSIKLFCSNVEKSNEPATFTVKNDPNLSIPNI